MASSAIADRLQQQAPLLASAAVLVVFGLYLATQINNWLDLTQEPAATDSEPTAVTAVAPDLQQMERLFGAPPQVQNDNQVASQSSIALTLHGSFVHAQPERSIAIIQRAGGVPELFRPGAELDSGVSLQTVYADRVEILRNGSLETLYFPATQSAPLLPDDLATFNAPPSTSTGAPQEEDDAQMQRQPEAPYQQPGASGAAGNETPPE